MLSCRANSKHPSKNLFNISFLIIHLLCHQFQESEELLLLCFFFLFSSLSFDLFFLSKSFVFYIFWILESDSWHDHCCHFCVFSWPSCADPSPQNESDCETCDGMRPLILLLNKAGLTIAAGRVALSGEMAHLATVVTALTKITRQVLRIFSPLVVILELHLYLLPVEGTLIVAEWQGKYFFTHSAAAAWSFISAKAKQYSEFLFLLATIFSTVPCLSKSLLNSL